MTVIELFAGAGGASLGLLRAGFTEVRAVEWDASACATRRAAGLRCDEGDVRDPAHYEGVTADAVWSSFPCQAWSTAGKRLGKDDPRNGWPWTVDVLNQVKPRWFMAENVPGLTHHRGACNGRCADDCARLYFEQTILRELRERFAWVDYRILDAARFGVPQNRERLIIVAGPHAINWPKETHAPPEELRAGSLFGDGRKPWRTVREALGLGGALREERGAGMIARHGERRDRPTDEPAPTIRAGSGSGSRVSHVVGIAAAHKSDVQVPWEEWIAVARSRGGSWCEYARLYGHDDEGFDAAGFALRDAPTPLPKWACHNHRGGHAAPLIEDPKHPHVRPESPAPTIRSGGSGHSSPPMWLREERGAGMSERHGARPDVSIDGPSPVIRAGSGGSGSRVSLVIGIEPWTTWRDRCVPLGGTWYDYAMASGHPEDAMHPDGITRRLVSPVPMPEWANGGAPKPTRAASRPELLDKPSPTVTAVGECKGSGDGGHPEKMQRASDALYLGAGIRRLTPAECAILQDFPPDHPWQGTKTSIYAQIGNAVPGRLAYVVGMAVRDADR